MVFLDVTIVNIAFPAIRHTFTDTSLSDLSWVLNGYNVVVAALLVPAGRIADRLGRRRVFFVGLALFLLGSVISGCGEQRCHADRGPRCPGPRRSGADPGIARTRARGGSRRETRHGDERLGGRRRRRRRDRSFARWRARRNDQLALGVLRQPRDRDRDAARAAPAARNPRVRFESARRICWAPRCSSSPWERSLWGS